MRPLSRRDQLVVRADDRRRAAVALALGHTPDESPSRVRPLVVGMVLGVLLLAAYAALGVLR